MYFIVSHLMINQIIYTSFRDINKAAIVWPLTSSMMSFKDGHLLRLRLLVATILPLRFYVHPVVSVNTFTEQKDSQVKIYVIPSSMSLWFLYYVHLNCILSYFITGERFWEITSLELSALWIYRRFHNLCYHFGFNFVLFSKYGMYFYINVIKQYEI